VPIVKKKYASED